jgi:hypothetical protein
VVGASGAAVRPGRLHRLGLEVVRSEAMVVVSELVTNAGVHADTACRVALRCRARGSTIVMSDHTLAGDLCRGPPPTARACTGCS